MPPAFNSLQDVIKKTDEIGPVSVLALLKEQRVALHPDKLGGKFSTEEDKKQYHFLNEAINQVELRYNAKNHLIPVSQLPALIEAFSKATSDHNKPNSFEIEQSYKESFKSELSRKYFGPKVGSSVFAAITGFLFFQSKDFSSHPIIGPIFDKPLGIQVVTLLFIISTLLFIFTWLRERQEESCSDYLLGEEALRNLYSALHKKFKNEIVDSSTIRNIMDKTHKERRLNSSVMEKIVEIQIQKLIDRKVIELVDKPGIVKIYRIVN